MLAVAEPVFAESMTHEEVLDTDVIYALLRRPEWHARAACRGDGDLFFVEREEGVDMAAVNAEARSICATCPVIEECAQAGRRERHGIWAGQTVDRLGEPVVGMPEASRDDLLWLDQPTGSDSLASQYGRGL